MKSSPREEDERVCRFQFLESKKVNKEGMTLVTAQALLHQVGLTMMSRFNQVHALSEEWEYGHLVSYELYICQEEHLISFTPAQFLHRVQEAQRVRTQLQRSVRQNFRLLSEVV